MAFSPLDELDALNERINDLQMQLGKPIEVFDIYQLETAKRVLKDLQTELKFVNSESNQIYNAFKNSVLEIQKQTNGLKSTKDALKGLTSISDQLRQHELGIKELSLKQLDALKGKYDLEVEALKNSKDLLNNRRIELETLAYSRLLEEKEIAELIEITGLHQRINEDLQDRNGLVGNLNKQLLDTIDRENQINHQLGLAPQILGGLSKTLSKLGIPDLGFDKALSSTKQFMREQEGTVSASDALSKFTGEVSTNLSAQFSKANLIVLVIEQLVEAFLKVDKLTGDIAKSMNLSYHSALETTQELTSIANSSASNFVTTQKIAESYMSINKTLGTNVMLNKEVLTIYTKLREISGMTNEELKGITAISLATGTSLKQNTGEFIAQAKITSLSKGVILNEKDLLKEIGNVSAATTLSLSKNPKLLADAAATAKALGIEMSKLEGIADHMMDFETSIGNELQAELLLGRDINLERARAAALNNDIARLAREITQQVGNANDFSKMNLLQQESIAKSVGMSREELAKSLFIQEQLRGVSGEEAKKREEILNKRIAEVGLAKTQNELAKEGFSTLMNQASMQDRFNVAIEKLKELFVSLIEPLMPILDVFTELLGIVGILMKLMNPLFQLINMILAPVGDIFNMLRGDFNFSGTKKAAGNWWKSVKEDNIISSIKGAGDVISPSQGRTQISTKEGELLQLSPNDDLIAAPNIVSKLTNNYFKPTVDNYSKPILNNNSNLVTNNNYTNQSPQIIIDNKEAKETNMLLRQLLTKQGTIKIDNTEIGTAFAINTYEIQ